VEATVVIVRVEVNGKVVGPPFRYADDAHQWVSHWHPGERYSIITINGFRPWRADFLAQPGGPASTYDEPNAGDR
jgi:hypothetical protein